MVLQRPVLNAGTIPSAAQVKGAASKAVTFPFPRNEPDLPGPVVNLQLLQEVLKGSLEQAS